MQPYYDSGGILIYHGDCRNVLPSITADCFVTDPPFGVGLSYASYDDTEQNVLTIAVPTVAGMVDRGWRGAVIPGTRCLQLYPRAAEIGGVYLPRGAGRSSWGFSCLMPVLYYGRDPFLANGEGGRPNSMWAQATSDKSEHPCPKPQRVISWLVARVSRPGECIADPFMGSGTTLRAAKDLGLRAVGIEIEERYCEIAARRLDQEVLPFAS